MFHVGVCIIAALFVVSISHWVYRWRNPKCNGNLPPGSMGWPLLGETIHFFTSNQTWDTPAFIKNRMKRYGSIFRTSLLGLRVIVSADSELSYMVFQQEGESFESWYPKSLTKVFGNQSLGSLHGNLHKYLRNMVLTVVGSESLKNIFSEVESAATRNMEEWASRETVELKNAFADGRKKVMRMLKNMLESRRAKPNKVKNDFFDYVLDELQRNDTILTEEISLELIFALMFANFETTSQAITLAIKFLTDNPRALKELTEEHEKILGKRENPKAGLTWEEYKSMTFTFQIINETLRLGNIAPAVFRKAKTDVKFKDYTIPSGWVVMVCPPAVHLDTANYTEPLNFNPWRWEGMDLKGASHTFMPFGGGLRYCVGADFARLQIAIFLHCLVTKYRWQLIKGGDIVRNPGLEFPHGFHVQLVKKDKLN